jgi:hypothetical protein
MRKAYKTYRQWWRRFEQCRPVVSVLVILVCGVLGFLGGCTVALILGRSHPFEVTRLPWLVGGLLAGMAARGYARTSSHTDHDSAGRHAPRGYRTADDDEKATP